LNANDPLYKNKKHKLFLFNMEAGKSYTIDMKSMAFDSYLYLEDPDGNLLAMDDDGGGFPDARITIKAAKTGKHRIIATYFGAGNLGEFTLTIKSNDADK
jgi:serine protease Do